MFFQTFLLSLLLLSVLILVSTQSRLREDEPKGVKAARSPGHVRITITIAHVEPLKVLTQNRLRRDATSQEPSTSLPTTSPLTLLGRRDTSTIELSTLLVTLYGPLITPAAALYARRDSQIALPSELPAKVLPREANQAHHKPNTNCESTPTFTSTSAAPIPTKKDSKCNIQGYPSSTYNHYVLGAAYAADVLACQRACLNIRNKPVCEAYSFQPVTSSNGTGVKNCVLYYAAFDSRNLFVIPNTLSPLRFSDRLAADGSNFCYGSQTIVL